MPLKAVRRWLEDAESAARRVRRDPCDAAALHRFRVGARRLVVYCKAGGAACGVPPRLRRRLRRALRATGPSRDRRIASQWLAAYARRRGGARLEGALRGGARAPGGRRWWRGVGRILRSIRESAEEDDSAALRAAQTEAARAARARLFRDLRRLRKDRGERPLHTARISVKRLRYLLEAMDEVPAGLPAPSSLAGLQAALGEAHDRDVVAAALAGERGRAARRAGEELARERRARLACAERLWRPLLRGAALAPR